MYIVLTSTFIKILNKTFNKDSCLFVFDKYPQ